MTYDEIMHEITKGLSGDRATDMKYLQEQMEKYKTHELAQEILRACGRMMYELIPDDKKDELGKLIGNDLKAVESTLDEIRYNVYKKDFDKAMQLSEALVKKIDKNPMFENDRVSEYFTFNEFFEELLYVFLYKPQKTIRRAELPYAEVYLQYGSLLFEQKKYLEAREVLEKAKRWNPMSAKIAFEYMETFKALGDIDKFAELSKEVFTYAFRTDDIARCYRNLGFYFIEKELYKEAAGCYLLSLQFDKESKNAQSELYYIQSKASKGFTEPTLEELISFGKKYGFPIGASEDVLGLAFAYGKHFAEQNQKETAIYCLEIVYELTNDGKVKKMIDAIKGKE